MNFDPGKLIKSFGYALRGLKIVVISQQNFRFHFIVACMVVMAGILARLTVIEWCIITITIFLVFAIEVVNTAIEKLVDFVSPGFHEQAGMVKDISAAAVLLTAFGAVIVGIIIFLPRILLIR
jgi:diacylglycerol kinase